MPWGKTLTPPSPAHPATSARFYKVCCHARCLLQCLTAVASLSPAFRSNSEPLQQETALRAAESLIRSQPVDLSEVGTAAVGGD